MVDVTQEEYDEDWFIDDELLPKPEIDKDDEIQLVLGRKFIYPASKKYVHGSQEDTILPFRYNL